MVGRRHFSRIGRRPNAVDRFPVVWTVPCWQGVVTMMALSTLTAEIELRPELPSGGDERFAGFGVMGLPFASGHVLAMRRFPASSIGPVHSTHDGL